MCGACASKIGEMLAVQRCRIGRPDRFGGYILVPPTILTGVPMTDLQARQDQDPASRFTMDSFELLALSSLRLFFGSYCGVTQSAYELTLRDARAHLGANDGPMFVALMNDFVAGIRNTRLDGFSFMSAGCAACQAKMTADELSAMRVIQAARARELALLVAEIERLLAGTSDHEEVFEAALRLAEFMNKIVQSAQCAQECLEDCDRSGAPGERKAPSKPALH